MHRSPEKPGRIKLFRTARVLWRIFKTFVFLFCMSCLIYQSVEFYRHYYTFPTTIDIEVLKDVPFKKLAVTFCYKAMIGRSKFCADHPHLCERPENLPEFCRRHSHYCKGDLLSLVIPKFGYFTNYSKETEETARDLLIESQDVPSAFFNQSVSITYVEDPDINTFAKCYSKHLHLYSDDDEDEKATTLINLTIFPEDVIYNFKIELPESELFYPWERTQVYAAVHSPYVPFNPIYDGIGIRPGYDYYIDVRLEEEHLLPHPYKTDCFNYDVSGTKNKSGPRSQEACRESCRKNYLKQCLGCDVGRTMEKSPKELCDRNQNFTLLKHGCGPSPEEIRITNNHLECLGKCKPDCVKLNYLCDVVKKAKDPITGRKSPFQVKETIVQVLVTNPDVTVLSHKPLYGNGELFSYIGGLIGCWLGISVWTLAGILEKSVARIRRLARKLKRKTKRLQPGEDYI